MYGKDEGIFPYNFSLQCSMCSSLIDDDTYMREFRYRNVYSCVYMCECVYVFVCVSVYILPRAFVSTAHSSLQERTYNQPNMFTRPSTTSNDLIRSCCIVLSGFRSRLQRGIREPPLTQCHRGRPYE